jgi:hypothetical protein
VSPNNKDNRPLDDLLPELGDTTGDDEPNAGDAAAVHPSVLEVGLEHHREWALACWYDPGPDELAAQIERLVVATLLAEWSQPPSHTMLERNFEAIELLVFGELGPASRTALGECGFEPASFEPDQYKERMATWHKQARRVGVQVPETPTSAWRAALERPKAAIADKLDEVAHRMVDKLDGDVWGATPGGPSRLMATIARQILNANLTPNRDGLHALELLLVQQRPATLRWISPVLFQGLCDFIGVVLQAEYGFNVQWAMCSPDASGMVPPPLFRVQLPGGPEHIPVGRLVVKWCAMARGEQAPSLAERVDELATSLPH